MKTLFLRQSKAYVVLVACATILVYASTPASATADDNLLKPDYGVIVLPSSQSDSPDEYAPSLDDRDRNSVEKIMDGDFTTAWISQPGTFPNWVEARWPQPVALNKLVVNENGPFASAAYRIDALIGRKWKVIVKPTANKQGTRIEERFPPVETTRIRYYMLKPEGDPVSAVSQITELRAHGSAAWIDATNKMGKPSGKPDPKAVFTCSSTKTAPAEARPGSKVKLSLEMQLDSKVKSDYGFIVRIGEKNIGTYCDYDVASVRVLPRVATSQWEAGKTYLVSIDVFIPDWAPHGEFGVFVSYAGAGAEGVIKNSDDGYVGTIRIKKFASEPEPWPAVPPRTEVRYVKDQAVLQINGKTYPPFIMGPVYRSYRSLGEYAKTGNHFWRVYTQIGLSSPYMTDDRAKERERYLQTVDQDINAVLKVDPDAYIIVVSILSVSQAWTDKYPDDAVLLSDGSRLEYSLSSRRWIAETNYHLTTLVDRLKSQSYSGHVVGVHFSVEGETYCPGFTANPNGTKREDLIVGDYSPEHIRAFRIWLQGRYNNDVKALKTAWNDETVTFETAYPDHDVLRQEDLMGFKDPAKTRMPFDYWEFHSDAMAERIIECGKTVKEASGGNYITGFWGLYSNGMIAANSYPGFVQHCGYAGLQKVMESPYIDYIGMLNSYTLVRWGTPMVPWNLTESIRRHRKIPLVEFDIRTFFIPPWTPMRTLSQKETLSVVNRDAAAATVRGYGCWWVDSAYGTEGRISVPWFSEESIIETLKEDRKVYEAAYKQASSRSVSEIAVFINNADAYALDVMFAHNILQNAQYNTLMYEFPKLGAPFDMYHIDDIALPNMDQYKVYVFLNAYNLTKDQRDIIGQKARKAGKTAVWLYAPGFCDGSKLSVDTICDLTGFKVRYDEEKMVPQVLIQGGHAPTAHIPAGHTVQPRRYMANRNGEFEIGPIFYVDDPSVEVLGKYVHNNKPAYAFKKMDAANSIFLAIPFIDSTLLRDICRFAGAHLYSEEDVYMDVSENFLSITAGEKGFDGLVKLPKRSVVYDIRGKKTIAGNANSFRASVPALDTAIYFIGAREEADRFRQGL